MFRFFRLNPSFRGKADTMTIFLNWDFSLSVIWDGVRDHLLGGDGGSNIY